MWRRGQGNIGDAKRSRSKKRSLSKTLTLGGDVHEHIVFMRRLNHIDYSSVHMHGERHLPTTGRFVLAPVVPELVPEPKRVELEQFRTLPNRTVFASADGEHQPYWRTQVGSVHSNIAFTYTELPSDTIF